MLDIHQHRDSLPLQGDRLSIRLLTESDLSDHYLSWLNDPETVKYSNQRFINHSIDSVRHYFNSFAGSANAFLAIEEQASGQLVGTMTAYIQPHHGTADVGILLGEKRLWGQGYGGEAWNLVIQWLLDTCAVRKVTAGTLACNHGMIRVMERAGMQHEATRRNQELVNNEPQDIVYFAKFHAA